MLLELTIKNFALIDNLNIKFSNGFNVLTGETGAGKSILIDSVNFILGDKQGRDIIRTGEDTAFVEGVFECPVSIKDLLVENGIDDDDLIIISREMNSSGRSLSRINGRTVTVSFLKSVGKKLIDIHGQHEHQSLLDEKAYIGILDSFGDDNFKKLKNDFHILYLKTKEIEREIEKASGEEQAKLRKIDLLKFQISEIEEANLKPQEEEEISRQREILLNSEKIYNSLSISYNKLYESNETNSVYDEIGVTLVQLEQIEKYDFHLQEIKQSLEDVYYKLEDIVEKIRDFRDKSDFNPADQEYIEQRYDLILKLKRKYGNTIEDILSYFDNASKELNEITRSEEILEKLINQKNENNANLDDYGKRITKIRKLIAKELSDRIINELQYLGMDKALFKAVVSEEERINENGFNNVEFLITANPGEPLKPLYKTASGGEMSRIMLAIKSVIADVDKIPTLIFDEIDTGISGRTAQTVAEKINKLSDKHQILCVTHLPQIASMAEEHFFIEKVVSNERTTTMVKSVKDRERINEISRMISGTEVTELTFKHAKEMLDMASSYRKMNK